MNNNNLKKPYQYINLQSTYNNIIYITILLGTVKNTRNAIDLLDKYIIQ